MTPSPEIAGRDEARACLQERYSRRKDIDAWLFTRASHGFGDPDDLVAVSFCGVVKPRRLAIVRRKRESLGIICVYLGGIFPDPGNLETASVLFCDFRADDALLTSTIPIVELSCISRVLGTAAINKPWRDLECWRLPNRERAMAKKLEAEMQPLASPIQAFDIDRMRGNNSVH